MCSCVSVFVCESVCLLLCVNVYVGVRELAFVSVFVYVSTCELVCVCE